MPDACIERGAQLAFVAGIPVHHDGAWAQIRPAARGEARRAEATSQPSPSCANNAQHRGRGERLGGEHDLEVLLAGTGERGEEGSRTAAQVVLGDDVGGRAETLGELHHVAAADLQVAAVVYAGCRSGRRARAFAWLPLRGDYRGPPLRPSPAAERQRPALTHRGAACPAVSPWPSATMGTWPSKRSAFGRDGGPQARMVLTMFMLGLLYAALVGALLATSTSVVLIVVIAVGLFSVQLIASDKIALATLGAHEVSAADEPELHAIIERLCIQADLPKPRIAVIEARMPNACALGRSQKAATICATRGLLSWGSSRPSSRA